MLNLILGMLLFLSGFSNDAVNRVDEPLNGTWRILPDKSSFEFKIPVMFVFPVTGTFSGVNGTIEISRELYNVKVDLTIDPSSIDTGNEKRDDHLKSEDFFYVGKYPSISFSASKISRQATDDQYTVEGDLTIRDVTKNIVVPIKLDEINSNGEIVFSGSKNINRQEFNIKYSGRGVGDVAEVDFTIVAEKVD